MTDSARTTDDGEHNGQASPISIDALADRVFRLLQRDLELERRRAGIPRQRRSGE